jgi:hypothetical protein
MVSSINKIIKSDFLVIIRAKRAATGLRGQMPGGHKKYSANALDERRGLPLNGLC